MRIAAMIMTWVLAVLATGTPDARAGEPQTGSTSFYGRLLVRAVLLAAGVLVGTSVAHAEAPYDGSVLMKCAIQTVMVCRDPSVCVRGTAQTVSLPPVITVDVGQRLISGSASGRTARITSTGQGAGKFMVAGQEIETLGNMWGLVIEQKTGAMSGAVLSHGGGFLMFGACTAP